MRQHVYTMFINNNHALIHLLLKENLVNYQKVSKYYVHDSEDTDDQKIEQSDSTKA